MAICYIATKLENHAAHNRLRNELKEIGIGLTYDWTPHGPVRGQGRKRIREVALLESNGVANADFVIVLLPGGRGTHAELGMAIAYDKPIILFSALGVGLDDGELTCAFYHHPLVEGAHSWAELIDLAKVYAQAASHKDRFTTGEGEIEILSE